MALTYPVHFIHDRVPLLDARDAVDIMAKVVLSKIREASKMSLRASGALLLLPDNLHFYILLSRPYPSN